jgi:hypothetical protein
MERRSGKRSSSVGSEKMERVGTRQEQTERYGSTSQSPQRAVATTKEEEEIYPIPMMNDNLLQTIQNELTSPCTHKKIYKNLICLCLEKTSLV